MASRAHRWKGDDTPLTGVHGGTANAALHAVKLAKKRRREAERELYERAHAVVREVIARNQVLSDSAARKDRLRPHRRAGKVIVYIPMPAAPLPPVKVVERVLSAAEKVWENCGGRCVYCGKPMLRSPDDPLSFSIDHDVPK